MPHIFQQFYTVWLQKKLSTRYLLLLISFLIVLNAHNSLSALPPKYAIPIENSIKSRVNDNITRVTDILQLRIKAIELLSNKQGSGCSINQIYSVSAEILTKKQGKHHVGDTFTFSFLYKDISMGCVGPTIYSLPKLQVGQIGWFGFICDENACQWVGKNWALNLFDPAQTFDLTPEIYCEGLPRYYSERLQRSLFISESSFSTDKFSITAQHYAQTIPRQSRLHYYLSKAIEQNYSHSFIVNDVAFSREKNTLTLWLIIDESLSSAEETTSLISSYLPWSTHFESKYKPIVRSDIDDCKFISAELIIYLDSAGYDSAFEKHPVYNIEHE